MITIYFILFYFTCDVFFKSSFPDLCSVFFHISTFRSNHYHGIHFLSHEFFRMKCLLPVFHLSYCTIFFFRVQSNDLVLHFIYFTYAWIVKIAIKQKLFLTSVAVLISLPSSPSCVSLVLYVCVLFFTPVLALVLFLKYVLFAHFPITSLPHHSFNSHEVKKCISLQREYNIFCWDGFFVPVKKLPMKKVPGFQEVLCQKRSNIAKNDQRYTLCMLELQLIQGQWIWNQSSEVFERTAWQAKATPMTRIVSDYS